ncbi:MAG: oxidoreductase, partial [Promethearchaeota archaeon]
MIFTPKKIGNVKIPNRLVRSATYESRATLEGYVTDELIKLYENLARGGIGLTITGMTIIREDGRQLEKMVCIYSDDYIEGLSRLAGSYHD